MKLSEIYNIAKRSSDYSTFLTELGQKIGISLTDARSQDITLEDLVFKKCKTIINNEEK